MLSIRRYWVLGAPQSNMPIYIRKTHLSALKPPNNAPLAIPTQNPMVKPYFIFEKQLGWWFDPYILPGTAGIFQLFEFRFWFASTWIRSFFLSLPWVLLLWIQYLNIISHFLRKNRFLKNKFPTWQLMCMCVWWYYLRYVFSFDISSCLMDLYIPHATS